MAKHLKMIFTHEVNSKELRFGRSYKKTAFIAPESQQLIRSSLNTTGAEAGRRSEKVLE